MRMSANRIFQQRDLTVIDANDPAQVKYMHYQFPWLSHDQIKKVIREHGPDRDAVHAYLERMRSDRETTG